MCHLLHDITLYSNVGMYGATQGAYSNGASVYICTCRVVEYRASENVTPVISVRNCALFQ